MNKIVLVLLLIPFMLSAISFNVTVPSDVEWFNSEIVVYENEFILVQSEGIWQYDPRPNFKTGPEGLVKGRKDLGSLLMKCNNEIILIEKEWEGIIEEECTLHFGMYDDIGHSNNLGSLNVNVNVEREEIKQIEDETEVDEKEKEIEIVDEIEEEDEEFPFVEEVCSVITFLILLSFGVLYVQERSE